MVGAKLHWVLGTLLLVLACSSPEDSLVAFEKLVEAGDTAGAEERMREALERHPDDVELLLAATNFYLQPEPEDFYRPRLALHYAMRSDKAASYGDPRAAASLLRAHRAAGGFQAGDELVSRGLSMVNHPHQARPDRLSPVDPDLLEPTLPNILEQKRRRELGAMEPRCATDSLVLVPEGIYPLADPPGASETVEPYCVTRQVATPVPCEERALRDCSGSELRVASGPMAGLLRGDAAGRRCCGDVEWARPGAPEQAVTRVP